MRLLEKKAFFKEEIKHLKDKRFKKFISEIFKIVPGYSFTVSTSSTGKHHPPDERGDMGNVIHTRRVVQWCFIWARALNIFHPEDLDVLIASAIIHDLAKRGLYKKEPEDHTVKEHASLMLVPIKAAGEKAGLPSWIIEKISRCVLYHNGRWTEKKHKKPVRKYTNLELCLHLADMAAANMHKVR